MQYQVFFSIKIKKDKVKLALFVFGTDIYFTYIISYMSAHVFFNLFNKFSKAKASCFIAVSQQVQKIP